MLALRTKRQGAVRLASCSVAIRPLRKRPRPENVREQLHKPHPALQLQAIAKRVNFCLVVALLVLMVALAIGQILGGSGGLREAFKTLKRGA